MVDNRNATLSHTDIDSDADFGADASSAQPSPPGGSGTATHSQALAVLRELVGNAGADFHDGQYEAIEALVDGGRRTLVVQRTGWGKSAVYFVASLLLRRRGAGPTLIVSPLLALMRDQVAAAARAGVRAVAINSANQLEWDTVREQLAADQVDVLLVSPERLTNPSFRENQLPELIRRTGLLVIDEAHCISDWGHDFRPDYRRIADLIEQLPGSVPVLATTATANSRVVHDIEEQLGAGVLTIRGALGRDSLRLGVLTLPDARQRLGWLLTHLSDLPGSGIIYTLTVSAAEDTARLLAEAGHEVLSYTGRTDPADRERAEQLLKDNQVKALVATSALGMGFDKPDLGFVGPPRGAVVAGCLLPAGGPCRPWSRQRRCPAVAGLRGPGHLAVLRHRVHAVGGESCRSPDGPCRGGKCRVHRGAGSTGGPAPDPAGVAAQGPFGGWGRGAGRRRLALHRAAVGL
ncbi:ATP-dependent helicase YprA (DUF1998 family) [Arthrobacter sp. SORGH_AS 212]|nr:ATP-dependent helicase YprA (DUF1998 family) [Arthrobacter sp. SORGH_AS_0212]